MSYALSDPLARGRPLQRSRRAWWTLGSRLALLYAAVTACILVVVGLVVALRADAWAVDEGTRAAERAAQDYGHAFEEHGVAGVRELAARQRRDGTTVAVRVADERNVEILSVAVGMGSSDARMRIDEARPSGTSPWPRRAWQTAVVRLSSGPAITVVSHNDAADRLWAHVRRSLWVVGACALLCLVVGSMIITRRALLPLDDLSRTVERIVRSGDLSRRVRERGASDELGRLGVQFNAMLDRNERLVRAMRDSLDNVAHELRTPLTRLRAGAEVALLDADTSRHAEALADVVEETDRVLAMTKLLMDIAEAETGTLRLDKHREDLAGVVREAVELYEIVSTERGVRVVTNLPRGIEANVDRKRVVQVVANLLDNALKYTPSGGHVEVSLATRGVDARITVADNGIGIAAEDRARVWERLFRSDRSRSERGLGLGLSLVRAIVEAHGGSVDLDSELGRGTTFHVHLPRS